MIIGILWGIYFKNIFPFLLVIIVVYNVPIKNKNIRKIKKICISPKVLVIFLVISLLSNMYILFLENKHKNFMKYIDNKINVKAYIASNIEETNYTYKYIAKVITINGEQINNANLIIYTKRSNDKFYYGDIVDFSGDYSAIDNARNYKGFSYYEYVKKDNIYGICTVDSIKKLKSNYGIEEIFNNINVMITNRIKVLFRGENADLLIGIILGKKQDIDEDIISYFRNSSLSHILAVSGTHISYIILGISILLNFTKLPKKISKVVTIVILIVFTKIVGFSPSVVRATIMSILIISSGLFYRKSDIINNMSISIIFILLHNPYYIKDIGLLLSYGGVIGIVSFFNIFKEITKKILEENKILKYIKDIVLVSLSVQVILFPLTIFYFNSVSTLFFISNILVLPLIGLIIISTIIVILISFFNIQIAMFFSKIISLIVDLVILISKFVSEVPFSNFLVCTPSVLYVILYYIVITILFVCYNKKKRRD